MMFYLEKSFTFAASHTLTKVPEGHKCGRQHGHNYTVTIELSCVGLGRMDMILDFGVIKDCIHKRFDHRDLNEVFRANGIEHDPTAEVLCDVISDLIQAELQPENLGRERSSHIFIERVEVRESQGDRAWITRT